MEELKKYICTRSFSLFQKGNFYRVEFLNDDSSDHVLKFPKDSNIYKYYARVFSEIFSEMSLYVYFTKSELMECFYIVKEERKLKLEKISEQSK